VSEVFQLFGEGRKKDSHGGEKRERRKGRGRQGPFVAEKIRAVAFRPLSESESHISDRRNKEKKVEEKGVKKKGEKK